MDWQSTVYLSSLLIRTLGMGGLAFYAWRRGQPGDARGFIGLTLSESYLALAEFLSVISPTEPMARFWYNTRFLALAAMPVFWVIFALTYTGRRHWLSGRLVIGLSLVPGVTQLLLWTNPGHGFWVESPVLFQRNGPIWIAQFGSLSPGSWFIAYLVYGCLLLLYGIAIVALAAWRREGAGRTQAALLSVAATIALVSSLLFTSIPEWRIALNPAAAGMAINTLLAAAAILPFRFLRSGLRAIVPEAQQGVDPSAARSLAMLLLIVLLMATGITATGYIAYRRYEQGFLAQVESQLKSIAGLKVTELENWRDERLADGALFHANPAFSAIVAAYLANPGDDATRSELRAWLAEVQVGEQYSHASLVDVSGAFRLTVPDAAEPNDEFLISEAMRALSVGQVALVDFHRTAGDEPIHLSVIVPLYTGGGTVFSGRPLGVLALQIDPYPHLYPFILRWPTPSATAETILVRREGNEVVHLSQLRSRPDAPLSLRVPMLDESLPAVQAALGREGFVESTNLRGVPVLAVLGAVPNSPWRLVTMIERDEVYAPLRERLVLILVTFGAMMVASAAGLITYWRLQRLHHYRDLAQSAEALRESEARFRTLVEDAPYGIFIQAQQRVTYANRAALRLFGARDAGELIGQPVIDHVHPDYRELVSSRNQQLNRDHVTLHPLEEKILKMDGSAVTVEVTASPIHTGQEDGSIVFLHDVTERREAQAQLAERHATLQGIMESVATPVYSLDRDYRYTSFNSAHAANMKALYGAEIHIGDRLPDFQRVEEPWGRAKPCVDRALSGESVTESSRSGGDASSRRHVEITFNPIRDGQRGVIGASVFLADVTQRRQAEEALRGYSARLEAEVAERTRELRAAQEQLIRHEKLAVLGQLAGSIGHELRNPLGVMANSVYYLRAALPDAPPKIREYLGFLDAEIRTADKIITDLLSLARTKAGSRQAVSEAELVQQTLARHAVPESIEVSVDIPEGLQPVYADPGQVVQILGNLVTNACQAMPQGGKLSFSAMGEHGMIALVVRDTGEGVVPEDLPRLFQPLFSTKTKGVGLGLAVSQKLAEANGGSIGVESTPGLGCAFTLRLPTWRDSE